VFAPQLKRCEQRQHAGEYGVCCRAAVGCRAEERGVDCLSSRSRPAAFAEVRRPSVDRQWCGRRGKIDNCQVAIRMAYASRKEHVLIDMRLYLSNRVSKNSLWCRRLAWPGSRDGCTTKLRGYFWTPVNGSSGRAGIRTEIPVFCPLGRSKSIKLDISCHFDSDSRRCRGGCYPCTRDL